MSVTIKEIAQLAGVSRGTVDRVLNNRGNVKPDTAKRIEELAASLGYTPNKAATALAAKKKNITIGVLVISEGNTFFDDILLGIQHAATQLSDFGLTLQIETMKGYDVAMQLTLIDKLVGASIHGLVITPINDPLISKKLNHLTEDGLPIVALNTAIEETNYLCYVGVDYYKSGQIAAGLLGLLRAHTPTPHIGIITGSFKSLGHNQRIQGFKDIMAHKYPHAAILATVENNDDEVESFEVTQHLLQTYPDIDSLYLTAAGVHGAVRAATSLNRLDQLAIICCDATPTTSEALDCGAIAATICQQPISQGQTAVEVLFDYLVYGSLPDTLSLLINNEIKIAESI